MKSVGVVLLMVLAFSAAPSARSESKWACPSVGDLALQWAESIAAGALVSSARVERCLSADRRRDIHLPRTSASEPEPSESLPESIVARKNGFRVESVRNGELGTRVVRLSWNDPRSGKHVEDELALLLNSGKAVKELGCAGLFEAFQKYRVRLQGCR